MVPLDKSEWEADTTLCSWISWAKDKRKANRTVRAVQVVDFNFLQFQDSVNLKMLLCNSIDDMNLGTFY